MHHPLPARLCSSHTITSMAMFGVGFHPGRQGALHAVAPPGHLHAKPFLLSLSRHPQTSPARIGLRLPSRIGIDFGLNPSVKSIPKLKKRTREDKLPSEDTGSSKQRNRRPVSPPDMSLPRRDQTGTPSNGPFRGYWTSSGRSFLAFPLPLPGPRLVPAEGSPRGIHTRSFLVSW